jgi:imidazolonepropionase-like amidohydrolase
MNGIKAPTRESAAIGRVLAVLFLAAACLAGGCASPAMLAIVDVSVVDVDTGVAHTHQTVLIRGERIAAVGPADTVRLPLGTRRLDGAGRYLIPGLWDMHVHDLEWAHVRDGLLAHGVTGARAMGGELMPALATRDAIARGSMIGPRVVTAGPPITGPTHAGASAGEAADDETGDEPPEWHVEVAETREQGRAAAAKLADAGVDFFKVHDVLTPEALSGVAMEARARGMTFAGHVPRGMRTAGFLAHRPASVEHMSVILEHELTRDATASEEAFREATAAWLRAPGDELLRDMASRRTALCPTLVAGVAITRGADPKGLASDAWSDPRVAALPKELRESWEELLPPGAFPAEFAAERAWMDEAALAVLAAAHRHRVPLLVGTDLGAPHLYPGESLHAELALFGRAGIPPAEALRLATAGAADFLGLGRQVGRVRPGMDADLVLLNGNPLDDVAALREIDAVVLRGRLLDRNALDRMLRAR